MSNPNQYFEGSGIPNLSSKSRDVDLDINEYVMLLLAKIESMSDPGVSTWNT